MKFIIEVVVPTDTLGGFEERYRIAGRIVSDEQDKEFFKEFLSVVEESLSQLPSMLDHVDIRDEALLLYNIPLETASKAIYIWNDTIGTDIKPVISDTVKFIPSGSLSLFKMDVHKAFSHR